MARKVEVARRRTLSAGVGGGRDERFHQLDGDEVVDRRLSTGTESSALSRKEGRTYFFGNLVTEAST
jgi:hypothetical protein